MTNIAASSGIAALGIMRQVLLGLAMINILLPILHALVAPASLGERSLWDVFATLIAPVMAPLFVVVILFDYVMSRVQAADADGDERARFASIARLELIAIAISLIFWGPYFYLRIL